MRLLACVLALAATTLAQDLESNLKEKLGKEFMRNAAWNIDYDIAKAKAKETGKPIFAYFTRSYQP